MSLTAKLTAFIAAFTPKLNQLNDRVSVLEDRRGNEIEQSGRIYCYDDERWVTSGDDNYGANFYQWQESGGTGNDPIQEWEHRGHIIREGTTIDNVILLCRILDINTIADMEILISFTDPQGRWYGAGIDNDAEDTHTELYRGFWRAGGGGQDPRTVTLNDRYARIIDLGQFVAPADGELRFYFKPVNMDPRPNTTTDYCQASYNVKTF